jgi:integrase
MQLSQSKTVGDAANAWLKRCERDGLDRQTVKTYRSQVNVHILPRLGGRALAELRRAEIKDYVEEMLDGRSRAMTRKVLVSLKSLLAEAVEREWIPSSPAADVKLSRQRRHEKRAEIPTKEEIRLLLGEVDAKNRPLIVTAVFTGMRISELRGLSWGNVDLERRVIKVRQRANRLNEMGSPKSSAGNREIPMAPMVAQTLRDWRSSCPEGKLGLVFPNGAGNIQSYGNIMRRVFYPLQVRAGLVNEAGVPKYGFHALRHAAASMMIEQNWPAKKIQTILGHSSVTMTFDVYGHLFTRAEDDLALFDKLEEDLLAA